MKTLLSIVFTLIFSLATLAAEQNTVFESVVKVHAGNSYGTGTCVNIDENNLYIITNRHVVGTSKTVNVRFYRQGHESSEIGADVIWTAYRKNEPVDIALLKVERNKLNWTPKVVNFELDDKIYNIGDTTLTIGCPSAEWPRAYKGHIEKLEGGTYLITPTVVPGQSGSVLFNGDGTKAIGLIAWYEEDNGQKYGKAMTAEVIQKAVLGKETNYFLKQDSYNTINDSYNFEDSERTPLEVAFRRHNRPNDCPDGTCPRTPKNQPNPKPDRDRILDRRKNDDQETPIPNKPGEGIKIFPTYPDGPNPQDKDEVVPKAPDVPEEPKVDEKYTTLENRVKTLEDTVANNKPQDNTELNKKIANLEIAHDNMSKDINSLTNKVTDLAKQVGEKPDKGDIVTPGKLDDFLKQQDSILKNVAEGQKAFVTAKEIESLSSRLNDSVKKVETVANTANSRIDDTLKSQANQTAVLIKEMKDTTTQVLKDPNNPINNVYNEYGQTAVGTGIPSIVALIGIWLFKKLADKHLGNLVGLLGGLAQNIPFSQQKNQQSQVKK